MYDFFNVFILFYFMLFFVILAFIENECGIYDNVNIFII